MSRVREMMRPTARRLRRRFPRLLRKRGHDVLAPLGADALGPAPAELTELVQEACRHAADVDLSPVADLFPLAEDRGYVVTWPGEHYRLLYGLCRATGATRVVEVGTYRGASALTFVQAGARVVTYDIIPVEEIGDAPAAAVRAEARIEQRLGDLADPVYLASQRATLEEADLVFVDGPKDGRFEPTVVPALLRMLRPGTLVVLDDVRFRCMRPLWRDLGVPRADVGDVGHWSGTGVLLAPGRPVA